MGHFNIIRIPLPLTDPTAIQGIYTIYRGRFNSILEELGSYRMRRKGIDTEGEIFETVQVE